MDKLCKCGCGQKTKLSWDKKKICDYVNGHSSKGRVFTEEEIEQRQISRIYGDIKRALGIPSNYGFPLCKCGCNQNVKNRSDEYIANHQPASYGMRGKKLSNETKIKLSNVQTGAVFTSDRRKKISIALSGQSNPMFGKKFSYEYREKLKGRVPWNKGKKGVQKPTPETKLKQSIAMVKYIEKHEFSNSTFKARVGKNELLIIEQLEKDMIEKGISNNKDLFYRCGKWPDRYYHNYNLVVEILESHHFTSNNELKSYDKVRELDISFRLGCMIYYVPEQEFLKNPEKEIQRFKDFLVLLEQGRN
jgi:hypothetical protein